MSLKIKLSLTGKKHHKSYRIVVAEKRSKRDGKPLDLIGQYNPSEKQNKPILDQKKLAYWLEKGAVFTKSAQKIVEL